jgi:uncharacterized membrane protein (UPF0127 family)
VTGSRRAAWLAAGAVVVAALVAGLVGWRGSDHGGSSTNAAIGDVVPARAPFEGLTAGTITVGGKQLRVVVADAEAERVQGLRQKVDASPYDGMLFVFPSEGVEAFTMAMVPEALEIVFFDDAGRVVDRMRMAPCPKGSDATCPSYTPKGPFRYALESGDGVVYEGPLAVPR